MGDRVAILSQGRLVGAIEPAELRSASHERAPGADHRAHVRGPGAQVADVAELTDGGRAGIARGGSLDAEPALELEDVTVEPGPGEIGAREVSLQVLKSEIMGIAGVDGNGQRELAEAIAGQRSIVRG